MGGGGIPEQGQLVQVRERSWVVANVHADECPARSLSPMAPLLPLLMLRWVEDGAEPERRSRWSGRSTLRCERPSARLSRSRPRLTARNASTRLVSSPEAFSRALFQCREAIATACRIRGLGEVSVGVLRLQTDEVDESFETEDGDDQAEDGAQSSIAHLLRLLGAEEGQPLGTARRVGRTRQHASGVQGSSAARPDRPDKAFA
ncbi:MAG: hypothetical protein R3C15_02600 [Thermoleophilia bacterium]